MKKIRIIIIAFLMVFLTGCSSKEITIEDIFKGYNNDTYVSLTIDPVATSNYSNRAKNGVVYLKGMKIQGDSVTSFGWRGSLEDEGKAITFDMFVEGNDDYEKNYFDYTQTLSEVYAPLGYEKYFLEIKEFSNDKADIKESAKIYYIEDVKGEDYKTAIRHITLYDLGIFQEGQKGIVETDVVIETLKNFQGNILVESDDEYHSQGDLNKYESLTSLLLEAEIMKAKLGFGDTFMDKDLAVTLKDKITWDTLSNQFSDDNGASVFKVPINVKNTGKTKGSINMFSYKVYTPAGVEGQVLSPYFKGNLDYAGDILPGGEQNSFIPIRYEGDGIYTFIFDNYTDINEIEISIKK